MNVKALKTTVGIWLCLIGVFIIIHFAYLFAGIDSDNRVIVDDVLLTILVLFLNKKYLNLKLNHQVDISVGEVLRVNSLPIVIYFFYITSWFAKLPNTSLYHIVDALLLALAVAVFEETFFRGILINNMLRYSARSFSGYLSVILCSSILFGVTHMVNLFGQSFSATLLQAINAFSIGVMLAAIYLRTGSLKWTILYHFMLDFTGIVINEGIVIAAPTPQRWFGVFVIDILYIFTGFFLVRKTQRKKLVF
ncbi:MAG: CPBP family intramembrane glutamic endopeptidase [Liquorilactobacillus hordei]|uniref:CPBP family intramembrane glutamic endopeptidase n=1 Tax=Liquorilactobacillus hordei TaxID=468911 RepID=UPI0039EA1C88